MSRSATPPAVSGSPRKSPLRIAATSGPSFPRHQDGRLSPVQHRMMMITEFEQWLRSRTNQEKRPFQEETVVAYAKAARALSAWMADKKMDGDFTACGTALLNRFFRDYSDAHTRGGTNTKQRNLRHLFTWLEAEYDHPHPYTDERSRYAPAADRPSTLSADFIKDLLAVTGGGRGNAFPDVRDHALIRVLTEGLRRTEVTGMRMTDLPLDLVSQRLVRVVPLKGARAEEEGRVVLVAPATARAVAVYLRARRYHRLADSPFVWLALRSGGPLDGMGLYRMLRRRPGQAGWLPALTVARCAGRSGGPPAPIVRHGPRQGRLFGDTPASTWHVIIARAESDDRRHSEQWSCWTAEVVISRSEAGPLPIRSVGLAQGCYRPGDLVGTRLLGRECREVCKAVHPARIRLKVLIQREQSPDQPGHRVVLVRNADERADDLGEGRPRGVRRFS
jgi:integrase/recombinase XerD